MPVDGETMVVVRLRNGETDVDRAGQYSWDDECGYSIIAYRYANPADEPEACPTPRAIQVGDDVRHTGMAGRGTVLAIAGDQAAVLWEEGLDAHSLRFLTLAKPKPKPLTDAVKLAIAVGALWEAVDAYGKPGGPWNVPSDPGGWLNRATEAIAKIEGKK